MQPKQQSMNITNENFIEQLSILLPEFCALNFGRRIMLDGLNDTEHAIAVAINMLGEEMDYYTPIANKKLQLIYDTLDLIINNKDAEEVEILARSVKELLQFNAVKHQKIASEIQISPKKNIKLSAKERLVIRLITEELTNRQISDKLGIGIRTIESMRLRIIKKLGAKNTIGIIKFAVKAGII